MMILQHVGFTGILGRLILARQPLWPFHASNTLAFEIVKVDVIISAWKILDVSPLCFGLVSGYSLSHNATTTSKVKLAINDRKAL